MTFTQLFNEFIDINEFVQSNHEIINKKNRFENHLKNVLGDKNINDIKYKDCQFLTNDLIYKKELSVKTVKNIISIVQVCFNYAIKCEYIDKNPALLVTFPKYDNKYNISLSKTNIKDLIDEILVFDHQDYKDIFIMSLHGRRKNEVLTLQWSQVDLDLKVYVIPPQKNKSKKYDTHSMTDLLFEMFKARYENAKKNKLARPADYVFTNPATLTRYKTVSKQFKKLKDLCNISKMRFHDFRHVFGTYAISKKVPIEHISQALGHSSIEVTQKYITKDSNISKNVCDVFLSDFLNKDEID